MNTAKLICVVVLFSTVALLGYAYGDNSISADRMSYSGKRIITEKEGHIYATSAEAKRQEKDYQAAIQLALGDHSAIFTGGLNLGYFMTPNDVLEVSILNGVNDHYDAEIFTNLIKYKRFWGNSFYTTIGLGYKNIKYSITKYDRDETYLAGRRYIETSDNHETHDLVYDVGIGNAWYWDNFYQGCDWIAYANRLVVLKEDEERDHDSENERFTRNGYVGALRYYLGYSF